jgi:ubiquinone/menaquinone biosynthesis C-methylase UbiE
MGEAATARSDGRAFDRVAAEYDRHRPTYPDELVDRACEIAGLRAGDRVLEVGCGTGQLTRSLVARGLEVTAVEPGERLLALAEEHLGQLDQVSWVNAPFEHAQLPDRQFRAVFSASAFHWIDPEVGWQKAARMLARDGTLALLSYFGLEDPRSHLDQQLVLSAVRRIAPEFAARWPAYRDHEAIIAGADERRENVSEVWAWLGSYDVRSAGAGRLFTDVKLTSVPTLLEHTAQELNGQLGTMSFYAHLSPSQRSALGAENAAIGQRLGRPIRSSVVAALVTARVVPSDDDRRPPA